MHKVAIIGSGAIGSAMAAHLVARGHSVGIWSRSFSQHRDGTEGLLSLSTTGAVEGQFQAQKLCDLSEIADYAIVIVALPGTAYLDVMPRLARHLKSSHLVIFSGSLSLAPLWLYEMALTTNTEPTICAWGTTLLAASFQPDGTLHIPFIRKHFELGCLPPLQAPDALGLCQELFGIDFTPLPSILDISLSNVNPVAHAGQLIVNFSRIDRAETWKLFENFTSSGVNIAEALDSERLKIAAAYGAKVRSLRRHYALSYPVEDSNVLHMAKQISAQSKTLGPADYNHRYLREDIPYGLAYFERLAQLAGIDAPYISATISLLQIMTRLDLRTNPIVDQIIRFGDTQQSLVERCAAI